MASVMTAQGTSSTSQVQEVQKLLQRAVDNTDRHYAHVHTFSIRFKHDDTKADRDTDTFQTILKLLGLPRAKEVVLDVLPGWDVPSELTALSRTLDRQDGKKLLIFHYAGTDC